MTVEKLITILNDFPKEMNIMVDTPEEYLDIEFVDTIPLYDKPTDEHKIDHAVIIPNYTDSEVQDDD